MAPGMMTTVILVWRQYGDSNFGVASVILVRRPYDSSDSGMAPGMTTVILVWRQV